MMIRNYDSGYVVVRHVHSSSLKEIYICRKVQEKNGREYTIIRIRDIRMCQQLISFFAQEIDEEKFTDFVECFTFEGMLNFVFLYQKGMKLTEKLAAENGSFPERLELAHKFMERIMCLNMPFSFLADALRPEHIVVQSGLEIRFNYEMSFLNRLNDYTIKEIGQDIDDIFRRIFAPEISLVNCPELESFLEWLKTGDYKNCLDIFYRFNRFYAIEKNKKPEDSAEPRSRSFRTWHVLHKGLIFLKRLLMTSLLIGALIWLIFSIVDYMVPDYSAGVAVERFDYIGTVEIHDDMENVRQTEGNKQ